MIFFRTERLLLRRFELEDLDDLARLSADKEVSRYVGDGQPLSREHTQLWINNSRANVERYGYGTGAIENDQGVLIGWGGIARPVAEPVVEEIIYGFAASEWGKGLGTEFLVGLIEWAKLRQMPTLRATVDAANRASIAMLLRQGFVLMDECFEGEEGVHLFVLTTHFDECH